MRGWLRNEWVLVYNIYMQVAGMLKLYNLPSPPQLGARGRKACRQVKTKNCLASINLATCNDNSDWFCSMVSHQQGWAHCALQDQWICIPKTSRIINRHMHRRNACAHIHTHKQCDGNVGWWGEDKKWNHFLWLLDHQRRNQSSVIWTAMHCHQPLTRRKLWKHGWA